MMAASPFLRNIPSQHLRGFTLIELSIVVTIIGLIIGAIMVGRDIYQAGLVDSQIAQITRYNAAVNQFRNTFTQLPGDINANLVTKFGFTAAPGRAGTAGQGDGNGLIEGYDWNGSGAPGDGLIGGEPTWFWEDLTANSGGLIEGNFNTETASGTLPTNCCYSAQIYHTNLGLNLIMPLAALGNNTWVYIYTDGVYNYYSVACIWATNTGGVWGMGTSDSDGGGFCSAPGITVEQAYRIDTKIDDGLPQSGTVQAKYENWNWAGSYTNGIVWSAGQWTAGATGTAAAAGSPTTCYDNGNVAGATQHYSMEISSGINPNCGLSFQFQ